MELSKRLYAVAGLVTEGASVADIGTDHGYIPIYLTERDIACRVIASDVKEGPLERARDHIAKHGLSEKIEVRLSDGLGAFEINEVDTMIAAGMGGALTIRILEEGKHIADALTFFILQPQSEIFKVRRYLNEHGFEIVSEDMVEEDGKYYPVMKAVHGRKEEYTEWEYAFGKRLLEKKHPVLLKYLLHWKKIQEQILQQLKKQRDSDRTRVRIREIENELWNIREALGCYGR